MGGAPQKIAHRDEEYERLVGELVPDIQTSNGRQAGKSGGYSDPRSDSGAPRHMGGVKIRDPI